MVNKNRVLMYKKITDTASLLFLGYNKQEICEKLGISSRTFSDYEKRMREMGLLKKDRDSDDPIITKIDFELLGIMSNGIEIILSDNEVSVFMPCGPKEC